MSVYGEIDLRFRPRPAGWRIFLVSLSQFVIALSLTSLISSVLAVTVLRASELRYPLLVYAPPWETLWSRVSARYVVSTETLLTRGAGYAFLVVAVVVFWLWPTRQSLATRHFAYTFALVMAIFGAGAWVGDSPLRARILDDPSVIGIAVGAIILCALIERRALELLGNVITAEKPSQRLLLWSLRIVPSATLMALFGFAVKRDVTIVLAALYALITLLVALSYRPGKGFEALGEVRMREAAAILPVVALLLIAGSWWVFGCDVTGRDPRGVAYTEKGVVWRELL